MSNRYVITNNRRMTIGPIGLIVMRNVDYAAILNIGTLANSDGMYVRPDNGLEPYRAVLINFAPSYHIGARCYEYTLTNQWTVF
ncbi:MAG: hypothetical protein ABGX16_03790 [Pirellulales bacterium]